MRPLRRVLCVLLVCCLAASAPACGTLRTVPPPTTPTEPPFADVRRGDDVVLTLRDGRRMEIEVERVDGDAIVSGEGVRYARNDIATVQVHRVSAWRTALLVGGIVAGAFVVAGIVIVSALHSLWGG